MPLAFASLLGGPVTMIGTPPNIIIATIRAERMGEPFAMFDFAPVGLVVAVAGILFTSLIGWRLIPSERRGQVSPESLFKIDDYIAEARVTEDSAALDQRISELEALADHEVTIVGIIRNEHRHLIPSGYERVRTGDVLILEGDPTALKTIVDLAELTLIGSEKPPVDDLRSDEVGIVEAVVNQGAAIVGRSPRSIRLRTLHGVNLLALARHGKPERRRLGDIRFQVGNVMLLQGITEHLPDILQKLDCLALAGSIFGLAIVAALIGLMPIHIAFLTAVAGLALSKIVSLGEAYDAIDWPIIVLLGAMTPVGAALELTGGAALVANTIVASTAGLAPGWVLLILFVGTMFVSDIIKNNATAVLMAPIAINTAQRLGVQVDPFMMAVALGASCAFLTPIGHQSNTLVMAPGGYRFADYWRMGLPLELLITIVGVPMILLVWPL